MSHVVSAEIGADTVSVEVEAGQAVAATDAVVKLESMKMETPVLAEMAGTVTEVVVTTDDVVHGGEPLVVITEA